MLLILMNMGMAGSEVFTPVPPTPPVPHIPTDGVFVGYSDSSGKKLTVNELSIDEKDRHARILKDDEELFTIIKIWMRSCN